MQLVYVDDLHIVTAGRDKFATLWMILLAYEIVGAVPCAFVRLAGCGQQGHRCEASADGPHCPVLHLGGILARHEARIRCKAVASFFFPGRIVLGGWSLTGGPDPAPWFSVEV